jgi:predicted RecB family nuclease
MSKVIDIEGVGPSHALKLQQAGIATTQSLLKKGATLKGREELAMKSGFSEKTILEWVNRADLFRIKGVAGQYSDLLENAGVDSVVELSHRVAEHLVLKMAEVNQQKKLVRKLPGVKQVEKWILQAGRLPRVVNY